MKTVDLEIEHTAVALTRKEKLLRWADLVLQQGKPLHLFHDLERWHPTCLKAPLGHIAPNAFGIAANDPVFKAAGIDGSSPADAMKFFELSQAELHEFSCDCGGGISNHDMAARITRLAETKAAMHRPSMLENLGRLFW
jgi:glyoxylate carboligase